MVPSNTLLLTDDLAKGEKNGLIFQDGVLLLAPGQVRGSLESPTLPLPQFTELVASWNSATEAGTYVELALKVKKGPAWSRWFSYGKWSDKGANLGSLKDQADEVARLEVDLLKVLEGRGDAVQYRLELSRENPDQPSPQVRLIALTWAPAKPTDKVYTPAEAALGVSPRAQLPVPEIGNIICSPTSLATVMAYHGCSEETEKVAAGVKDNGAGIYGNWSYNVAYAAERGFTAWVQRCDSMEDVKEYLEQGLPIIASVRIAAKEELTGALSAYSNGHLLVITGLTSIDGQDYVLVNDPAANRDEDVPRRYRLDQFLKAWPRKLIYVLQKP